MIITYNYFYTNAMNQNICFDYLDDEDEDEDLELLDPVLFLATSMLSTWIKISEAMRAKINNVAQYSTILDIVLFFTVVFTLLRHNCWTRWKFLNEITSFHVWFSLYYERYFVTIIIDSVFISLIKCIHLIEILFQSRKKL